MGAARKLALIGATALMTSAASAADFPAAVPPPHVRPPDVGGWYLRGDVGIGIQQFHSFDHFSTNPTFVWPASWRIEQKELKSAPFIGFGIGYVWNSWLRFDVTGEYRASVPFHALGSYTENCVGGGICFDQYNGNHSAWVALANAYIDLGTWWCLTPFVGAGVGAAYSSIRTFSDIGLNSDGNTGFGFGADYSRWTFAWAAHAGVAYDVTSKVKVEFAYRYLNIGNVQTGVINCSATGCNGNGARAYYTLTGTDSHDVKIGVRWMLQPDPLPAYQPPLMRRG